MFATHTQKSRSRRLLELGGLVTSAVLIAFGIATIALGIDGRAEVRDSLARENIVGTPDSTIPGQKVDTGSEAKAFASVMREHTLKISGGLTYAELGRYLGKDGTQTSDETLAAVGPNGQPVENPIRQVWVTETALTTALNMSFMAERLALFSIVIGIALLLTGIGFGILSLGGALRPAVAAAGEARAPRAKPVTS